MKKIIIILVASISIIGCKKEEMIDNCKVASTVTKLPTGHTSVQWIDGSVSFYTGEAPVEGEIVCWDNN